MGSRWFHHAAKGSCAARTLALGRQTVPHQYLAIRQSSSETLWRVCLEGVLEPCRQIREGDRDLCVDGISCAASISGSEGGSHGFCRDWSSGRYRGGGHQKFHGDAANEGRLHGLGKTCRWIARTGQETSSSGASRYSCAVSDVTCSFIIRERDEVMPRASKCCGNFRWAR